MDLIKKEAFRYFKMSSIAGDSEGMYHYATMLQNGDGTQLTRMSLLNISRCKLILVIKNQ